MVPTDGRTLVAVQRTDLDLADDPEKLAQGLGIADNRVAELDLDWDGGQLLAAVDDGADLADLFTSGELEEMRLVAQAAVGSDGNGGGKDKPWGGESGLGMGPCQVKAIVTVPGVAVFEAALKAAGEKCRGDALLAVCRAYLEGQGVADPP